MPTVPISQGPNLREQGMPSAYQRTPDVSSTSRALAQSLGAAGEAAFQIAERDAQTAAAKADTEITTGWLQWDAENRQKYQGANADGYREAADKWWKETSSKYKQSLDPMAQGMISQTLIRKQGAAMGNVLTFVGAEKERHADQTAQANVETTIQFGVTSGDVAGAAQRVKELAAEMGARKGWTTEQVQAEQGKQLSMLHLAQIAKLTEVDASAAQAYYDANKAAVGFAQQPQVEKMLKGERDNQFAVTFAATNAALPYEQQLAKAGEIKDPQRQEKVLLAIKNAQAQVQAAQIAREKQFSDKAWQLVGQGRRVPEAILMNMDGQERVRLQEHLRTQAEHAINMAQGKSVKTDPAAHAKLYDMMRDDPDAFRKLRLETLTTTMSPSDIEQVARLQRDMNKPDKEKDVATTTQLIGTYTGGWKPEKRTAFQSAMFDELDQFEREKKRPATFAEKRAIGDRLMLEGVTDKGILWDTKKKLYEATPAERKVFAPVVSADDRKLVVQALKAEGNPNPTEDQITARFKLAKGIR
jgi:hypothetical protein